MPTTNDEIIKRLDLLRITAQPDSLDNELVVVLGVKPNVDTILADTRLESFVVVVDNRLLTALVVFEHHQPIELEDLTIVDNKPHITTLALWDDSSH